MRLTKQSTLFGTGIIETEGATYEFDIDLSEPGYSNFIRKCRRVYLFGWRFRNYELLHKHEAAIREYFLPSEEYEKATEVFFSRGSGDQPLTIGVHVRHGDYINFDGGRHYLTIEKYASLVCDYAESLDCPVEIIVFSNQTQNLDLFAPFPVRSGPSDMYGDFFALAKCDLIIAPQSTFSGVASYLGQVPLALVSKSTDSIKTSDFKVTSWFGPQPKLDVVK